MKNTEQVTLKNGVKLYAFSSSDDLIDFAVDKKKILVAINAEKILHATEQTKAIMARNIAYSDGAGSVFALRNHGIKAKKISGCDLWLRIIQRLVPLNKSFYLIGARQDVIEDTVAKLRLDFPGIKIVGYRNGYINDNAEKAALLVDIKMKKPDVVFVAMGSPKQELLMEEMIEHHSAVYQGLGGSFDVYTGRTTRAPKWWIDNNLEFAYRLFQQPSRIKRQIHLVKFVALLLTKRI